jgi:hypothetical protein
MNAILKPRLTTKVRKEIGDLIARVGSLVRGDTKQRWVQTELPLTAHPARRRIPRVCSRLERN